ncbi:autotransporter outer membrane beta-barrel domain-containing protein [Labrys sp. ZIDIC5]|uniref:autotransporter outer membrane beta-barrel domain-containing protein n=1 Tax=Labrys sedimenti TaxID=3106036 RepID=UPI002ACAC566|nr:autotransporter outer membrane beta-barrel domain-containing protein [Labrys sp. ZIDIC5]MDZ5453453.1 autotransporter outer membrane beta-barrel domain-containing protein [Labrys sp. ZIDIC5]
MVGRTSVLRHLLQGCSPRALSIGSVLFATVLAATAMPSQAQAQCVPAPDAPVSISSGSCTDSGTPGIPTRVSNDATDVVSASGTGTYTGNVVELDASGTGSGAHASGGGTINLNGAPDGSGGYNTAIVNTTEAGSHGLYADGGGHINGNGVLVTTSGAGSHAIYATGTGSDVNVDYSGVTLPPNTGQQILVTNGDNAYGAYAANGGKVEITGIDPQKSSILTYGTGSSAFVVESGGQMTLNNLSGFLNYYDVDDTVGASVAGVGSSIVTNNTYINTYGNNSTGMLVADGGTATIHGGAVVTGKFHNTLISNSVALLAQGTGSQITIDQGGSVTTYGAASAGAVAQGGAFIDFKGYGIFTYETGSTGAVADGTDGNGTASEVAISNAIVRTTGPSSAGVRATGGGAMSVTGGEITTGYKPGFDTSGGHYLASEIGREANGAEAIGAGSTLTITDNKLTTTGDGAIGVAASGGGTATVAGGTITTKGAPTANFTADGVRATGPGSTVTLTSSANGGTAVTTSGVNAMGLHAMQGGVVDATNATVKTSGTGAFGALSEGADSNVKLTASTVTTQAASGLSVNGGGQINTTGTAVTANGTGSSGILGTGDGTVTMTGGSLSATGDLITGTAGNVVANLTGVAPTTGSGILVHAVGGTTSGNFTNMAMTGNVVGEVGARANATLKSSVLTGVAINADNMTVDANSTWNMTASSTVNSTATSTTNNTGLIVFTPPSGGAYKTLTTSNFVGGTGGAIGTVVLNTYLGSDGSPSDQIVIDGGTATGSTALTIVNNGGPGAATIHDGIEVVHVINGGTTSTDAFHLTRAVAAGAYDYNLFRGGVAPNVETDQNWFLRNVGLNESTQTVLPYAQILSDYSFATLGTLQQRTGNRVWPNGAPPETIWCKDPAQNFKCKVSGEQAGVYANGGPVIYGQGAWGRIGGQYSSFDPKVGSSYTQSLGFMQAGYEGAVYESATGTMTLGAYGTIGTARADIDITRDPATLAARAKGKITTTGYGIGANLTWLGNNGFYADAIAQFTWYDSSLSNKPGGNNQGWSGAASIEAGKRMDLGSGWALVPQAQLAYSSVDFEKFTDVNGARQELGEGNSLQGRIGVRIEHLSSWQNANNKTDRLQVYGIGNLSYQFLNGTKIDVANVSVKQQNKRLWGEVGLGGTYAWNDAWSAYGEADYATALSSGAGDNYTVKGTLGIRYNW